MKYIVGISEIVLWTADKEKALRFYHNVLGLEVISPLMLPKISNPHSPVKA
jgi:catechol 2,3-dioxygenase-like lactoylglutathione lyase family enzyme